MLLALVGGRVAGARLHLDGKPHLCDRRFQIARDIDGERLQRRDVERVDAAPNGIARLAIGERGQARQKTGQRLARAGGRDQQGRAALPGSFQQIELMGAHRPSACGEPVPEEGREQGLAARLRIVLQFLIPADRMPLSGAISPVSS